MAGPVSFVTSELARRFAVSRTHVRRLLVMLEQHGYYRPGSVEGSGFLTSELAEAFETFHAVGYVGMTACAHATLVRNSEAQAVVPAVETVAGSHALGALTQPEAK